MTSLLYFSVNLTLSFFFFFFYGSSKTIDFLVSCCQRTYLNNQPCDQAILDIIEHSSSNRKQIQEKDIARSHTDMELYKLNVSQLL